MPEANQPLMPEANRPLMPENIPESEQTPDTLVDAIVGKINDDIRANVHNF